MLTGNMLSDSFPAIDGNYSMRLTHLHQSNLVAQFCSRYRCRQLLPLHFSSSIPRRNVVAKRKLWRKSLFKDSNISQQYLVAKVLASGNFQNFARMSAIDFEHLLLKISPFIRKQKKIGIVFLLKLNFIAR